MANPRQSSSAGEIGAWDMFMYRLSRWVKSPTPYLMLVGFALFFGAWFLLSEVFKFWRFASLPGPRQVLIEWFNPNPVYGMSLYTPDFYVHIWSSIRRVLYAFLISTALGVPFGLFLGWSRAFREYTFPVFEMLRPIPVLAWVPLAIVMFKGDETPVIFLTTLASFYATALNTMLGVQSIDEAYPRAAACLGASKWQIFRHITYPLLTPIIAVVMTFSVLFTFTDFQLIWAMTRGGPVNATHLMATLSYQRAIIGGNLGEGAAISTAMIPFLLGAIMISWFGLQRRKWQQGGNND